MLHLHGGSVSSHPSEVHGHLHVESFISAVNVLGGLLVGLSDISRYLHLLLFLRIMFQQVKQASNSRFIHSFVLADGR